MLMIIKTLNMVEAAGVEPASENVTGQETTCLFAFMPQAFGVIADAPPGRSRPTLRTDKKRLPLACDLNLSAQT
jgi:hypothetical protein